tara:strand:- start:3316 stop:4908 length:1593 start_codon:yes stop_codon:yes gene_type:complete
MEIFDVIVSLFEPLEGVSYAVAPFVLSAIAGLPGMIQQVGAATDMERQARRDEARGKADARRGRAMLARARRGELEFAPKRQKFSKYFTDAYEDSLSRASEAAAAEARDQTLATSATGTMDPRTRMALMAQTGGMGAAARQDALEGLSQRRAAARTLGRVATDTETSNVDAFNEQMQKEIQRGQAFERSGQLAARAGRDAQRLAKSARRQALTGFLMDTAAGALTEGLTKNKSIPGTDSPEMLDPTTDARVERPLVTPEAPFGEQVMVNTTLDQGGGVITQPLGGSTDYTGGFGPTGDFPFLPGNNAQGGRIKKYQQGGSLERMMAAIQGDDLSSRLNPMSIYMDRIEETPYTTFGREEEENEDADLRKIIDQAIADYNKKQKEEEDLVKKGNDPEKETETKEAPKTEEAPDTEKAEETEEAPDTEEAAETAETEQAEETEEAAETEEGAMGMKYMGEEGFKTEGEFNHDTNKKAVIDEEDGTKEAELTGGELVFNPKQANTMEKLIEENNPRGLLKFLKNLLSKPQFKD